MGSTLRWWVTWLGSFVGLLSCARDVPPAKLPAPSGASAPTATTAIVQGVFPLPAWETGQFEAHDWAPLGQVFEGKSVVFLGESLHVTAEFPRVRLPVLRYLHERKGFDVVAVEGSMIDAWLAQDDLLRSPNDAGAVEQASRTGWMTLWNTEPMRAVLQYVHSTRGAPGRELYFASMDIQPAMGGTPTKKGVFRRFVESVFAYAGEGDSSAIDRIVAELGEPLRTCRGEQPAPASRVSAAAQLAAMIRRADPNVRSRWAIHADALALVPTMLDQRLRHCAEILEPNGTFHAGRYWKAYKEARDRYQAANVLALRDRVSRAHRVIVWAHHSHAAYQAAGATARTSIAGVVRDQVPGETYALGLYSGAGKYLRIQDGPGDSIELKDVPASGDPSCAGLDALRAVSSAEHGYLLDFNLAKGNARAGFLTERLGYPLEGDGVATQLGAEFDGVLFVPRTSEAKLD